MDDELDIFAKFGADDEFELKSKDRLKGFTSDDDAQSLRDIFDKNGRESDSATDTEHQELDLLSRLQNLEMDEMDEMKMNQEMDEIKMDQSVDLDLLDKLKHEFHLVQNLITDCILLQPHQIQMEIVQNTITQIQNLEIDRSEISVRLQESVFFYTNLVLETILTQLDNLPYSASLKNYYSAVIDLKESCTKFQSYIPSLLENVYPKILKFSIEDLRDSSNNPSWSLWISQTVRMLQEKIDFISNKSGQLTQTVMRISETALRMKLMNISNAFNFPELKRPICGAQVVGSISVLNLGCDFLIGCSVTPQVTECNCSKIQIMPLFLCSSKTCRGKVLLPASVLTYSKRSDSVVGSDDGF